jgi:hypothetical protein
VAETAKHTDLSDEAPGSRAVMGEGFELRGELPLLKLILKATMAEGSPLHRLVATVVIALTGCSYAITLSVIGLHQWDSACGLLLSPLFYCLSGTRPAGCSCPPPSTAFFRGPLDRKSRARPGAVRVQPGPAEGEAGEPAPPS